MLCMSVGLGKLHGITRQSLLSWNTHTLLEVLEQPGQAEAGWGGGWAPAESGAPTTQSVMESDPPLSAVRLPMACANTLPSINTVTRHTHTPLYKCTLTRWPSHTGDLVSAVANLPGNTLYKQCAAAFWHPAEFYVLYSICSWTSAQNFNNIFGPLSFTSLYPWRAAMFP